MFKKSFFARLKTADHEKLVEAAYHEELRKRFPNCKISTPHNTDGYLEFKFESGKQIYFLKLLIETKFKETFSSDVVRAESLVQAIYYLKKFDDAGGKLPNVVLVGDKEECFVIHANYLDEYLDWNCNWKIAPSDAPRKNVEMVQHIINNKELQRQCYVYVINENFDFDKVSQSIRNLVVGNKRRIRLNEKNISKIFEYFSMRILKRKASGEPYCDPRKQVELFMHLVQEFDDCYPHPKKKSKAVFVGEEVNVDISNLLALKRHYKFEYNAEEKKTFSAICDRLINDAQRRYKGDFYTPTIWVDEAHKMLSENLGEDWKEEYMVWDCAWGTGNLTRDYVFGKLYCSTLYEHDLEIGERYNREATKFQYDFLNDDVEKFDELLDLKENKDYELKEEDFHGTRLWNEAPDLIKGLLAGKKLLFFINPPYGTSKSGGAKKGNTKKGINDTLIKKNMGVDGLKFSTRQLYTQFVYRCIKMGEIFNAELYVALFSNISIHTYREYGEFRKYVRKMLNFSNGFMIQASNFADASDAWSVSFSVYKDKKKTEDSDKVKLNIKEINEGGVVNLGEKIIYNVGEEDSATEWVRRELIGEKSKKTAYLKTPLCTGKTDRENAYYTDGYIGSFWSNSNNVGSNNSGVSLWSSMVGYPACYSVTKRSFNKSLQLFVARRLIVGNYATWVNSKDEYMIPNTEHPKYQQWENDCIVYSLFNSASNQSSLRQIDYNNKQWDIYNHFFFMSKEDIKQLSLDHNNDEVYDDIHYHGQEKRFVYNKLQEVNLSPDTQAVLNKAHELVRESFQYRELFNQKYPEYHINTWDTGWYQIKGLLKEYMPEELKEFNQLYKQLEDRMRPLVVELGFLYDYPGYKKKRF